MENNKTLIIGLGNPILGDDGVGWVITQGLKDQLTSRADLEFDFLSLGGLSLMERLTGYQHVILLDSFSSGVRPIGDVISFPLDSIPDLTAGHSSSAHDTSLRNALNLGRSMKIDLPEDENIIVVAVEANNTYDFSENLSPKVAESVPIAVDIVKNLLTNIN